jgi:hypothetical protein
MALLFIFSREKAHVNRHDVASQTARHELTPSDERGYGSGCGG